MTERKRKDIFQAFNELHHKIAYAEQEADSSDLIVLMNRITFEKLCIAYYGNVDEHYISFFGVEVKIAPTLDDDQLWLVKRIYEVDIENGND